MHLIFLLLLLLARHCVSLSITCAAFDALPKLSFNNVAPQALAPVIISFSQDTSDQIIDAYRDALTCRGSQMDSPSYNIKTMSGLASLVFKGALESSSHITSVDVDGLVTVMTTIDPMPTPTVAPPRSDPPSSSEHESPESLESQESQESKASGTRATGLGLIAIALLGLL
ncbi:hypothetical protein GGF46_000177 [Coemansia sp. RSA 552]|nr:hypothetical protein GGF46_000177 [Coemansia sp. RSA 552]